MDQIIVRSLQRRASSEDEEQLTRWRAESSENETRYQEMAVLWRSLGAVPRTAAVPRPAAREIIELAHSGNRAVSTAAFRKTRTPGRSHWSPLLAAAMLVVGAGLGALWWNSWGAEPALTVNELSTGATEMVTATLSDGSTVRLAPESRLRVEVGSDREVWLEGQAFFDVATDGRPFVVRTRVGEAIVLGTRFDIRVDEAEVRVAVVEGLVALAAGGERVEAGAGEVGRALDGAPPSLEKPEDLRPMLAWMDGFFILDDTPLSEAAAEFERRFGIPTVVTDSALGARTVSAWFTNEEPDEVLSVVCRAVGATCTLEGGVATLAP